MKTIPSFTIDHIRLLRGIYVSRKDEVGGETVTTFDIRMKEPNREPALGQGALHTIEHLAATYLRNHPIWSDKIVYWGPMGCLTGNYLLMKGDLKSEDIVELMQETFRFVADFEGEVPAFPAFPLRVVYMSVEPVEEDMAAASILISVPKKRFKRAVKRNLVKRQVREAYRKNKHLLLDALASRNKRLIIAFIWLDNHIHSSAEVEEKVKKLLFHIVERLE